MDVNAKYLRRRPRDVTPFVLLNLGKALSQVHVIRLLDLCLMDELPPDIEARAHANHSVPIR